MLQDTLSHGGVVVVVLFAVLTGQFFLVNVVLLALVDWLPTVSVVIILVVGWIDASLAGLRELFRLCTVFGWKSGIALLSGLVLGPNIVGVITFDANPIEGLRHDLAIVHFGRVFLAFLLVGRKEVSLVAHITHLLSSVIGVIHNLIAIRNRGDLHIGALFGVLLANSLLINEKTIITGIAFESVEVDVGAVIQ